MENYCERCGEKLDNKTIVWLILDQDTGKYHKGSIPEGHISQGSFSFGKACAKKVLNNSGESIIIKKNKRYQ